jgi:hypothetical protein
MIDVFVSRPTWISPEFKEGLDGFLGLLESLQLNPRTLGATDYPTKAPLDEVISLLDECGGAVILGYPQIMVSEGRIKTKEVRNIPLATEWNHIEAGLAYARSLPLLVIHHLGVGRGIFDRGAINSFIYERDLSAPQWPLAPEIRGSVSKWKDQCVVPAMDHTVGAGRVLSGALLCPNCSKPNRPFYMSPIPPDFVELENATHECATCKYKERRTDYS